MESSVLVPRVSYRKGHKRGRTFYLPRVLVRCACCKGRVEIFHDCPESGDPRIDTIEINGVIGTIAQWREILLPLLQVALPAEAVEGVSVSDC